MVVDNNIYNSRVIATSAGVCYSSFLFIYLQLVCIYLQMSVFFHIYIYMMMACGKWFSKEGVEIFTYPGCHFTAMRTFASFW